MLPFHSAIHTFQSAPAVLSGKAIAENRFFLLPTTTTITVNTITITTTMSSILTEEYQHTMQHE